MENTPIITERHKMEVKILLLTGLVGGVACLEATGKEARKHRQEKSLACRPTPLLNLRHCIYRFPMGSN